MFMDNLELMEVIWLGRGCICMYFTVYLFIKESIVNVLEEYLGL